MKMNIAISAVYKNVKLLAILCSLLFSSLQLKVQATNNSDKTNAYLQAITQRSQKIAASLNIKDSSKFYKVQSLIVEQYQNLNTVHESCNAKIKALKADSAIEKQ